MIKYKFIEFKIMIINRLRPQPSKSLNLGLEFLGFLWSRLSFSSNLEELILKLRVLLIEDYTMLVHISYDSS